MSSNSPNSAVGGRGGAGGGGREQNVKYHLVRLNLGFNENTTVDAAVVIADSLGRMGANRGRVITQWRGQCLAQGRFSTCY